MKPTREGGRESREGSGAFAQRRRHKMELHTERLARELVRESSGVRPPLQQRQTDERSPSLSFPLASSRERGEPSESCSTCSPHEENRRRRRAARRRGARAGERMGEKETRAREAEWEKRRGVGGATVAAAPLSELAGGGKTGVFEKIAKALRSGAAAPHHRVSHRPPS